MRIRPAGLAILLLIVACGRGGPAVPRPVSWVTVASDARVYSDNGSGFRDTLTIAVRDSATLREAWPRATERQLVRQPPPAIDFSREMLLIVTGGGRATTQARVRVDSISIRREQTTTGEHEQMLALVRVFLGCDREPTDAFPVDIVRLPRFDGQIATLRRPPEPAVGCVPQPPSR